MTIITNRKVYLVFAAVAILIFVFLANHSKPAPNFSLAVSPMASTILLDNKTSVHVGNLYVMPGKHTITATMDGFSKKSISVVVNENKISSATIILVPSSLVGINWLAAHHEEDIYRQGLAGKSVTEAGKKTDEIAPLIKELPYLGSGSEFRIDYGSPESGSNSPVIIITAPDLPSQQDAIAWMKARGYNASDYSIQYVTAQP